MGDFKTQLDLEDDNCEKQILKLMGFAFLSKIQNGDQEVFGRIIGHVYHWYVCPLKMK